MAIQAIAERPSLLLVPVTCTAMGMNAYYLKLVTPTFMANSTFSALWQCNNACQSCLLSAPPD